MSDDVWDLVCVGAGISALTYAAAATARKPSLRVLVLERHRIPGGYSSEFHRPRQQARFDCSLHKLTGMGEDGNLRALVRELGLEAALDLRFSPTWFEVSGHPPLTLGKEPARVFETLCAAFPADRQGLATFFEEVETHGRNSYMQFEIMQGRYEPDFKQLRFAHRQLKLLSVRDALRERLGDPRLVELLAVPSIYVGTFPEQCSYLYYLHVVYASLHKKSAYPLGGSQRLSDLLVRQIAERGGEVRLNVSVQQVLVDEETSVATGVVTDKGTFRGRNILINAAPLYALKTLFPARPELDDCTARVASQAPANSTTTIYLVFDQAPETLGLESAETIVLADDPEQALASRERARGAPENALVAEEAYWRRATFEVTNYHVLDPSGGKVVIVNALDDIRHWPERKTPEYRAKKKRAVDVLLGRLFDAYPALKPHLAYSEVSSPRTYQRYTNNVAGSGYGALVSPGAAPTQLNNRFPFRNVTFLSAWISGSGYEATMGYSKMLAASAFS